MKKTFSVVLSLLLLTLTVIPAVAASSSGANTLKYYKSAFEEKYDLPDGNSAKMMPDVWTSYILKNSDNWVNKDYSFMKKDNYILPTANVAEMSKSLLLCSLYEDDFSDKATVDLINSLESKQLENGAFSTIVTDSAWSITALEIAKASGAKIKYNVSAATEYLKSEQKSDGGFNAFEDKGNVDTTGMVLVALKTINNKDANEIMSQAVDFMKSCMDKDAFLKGKGSYDSINSCSQSYGIIGLIAAGEDVTSDKWSVGERSIADALLDFSDKNGGFWYDLDSKNGTGYFKEPDAFSTCQSLMALCDLENGNLWVELATMDSGDNLTTTSQAPSQKNPAVTNINDTENPLTGEQPLNPVLILLIIIAVIALFATILLPIIKKKK